MMPYNMNFTNHKNTITFGIAYPDYTEFRADYDEFLTSAGIVNPPLHNNNVQLLYYLLSAEYRNAHFRSLDPNQSKQQIFATIFMYGPTWQTRLAIKDELVKLFEERDVNNEFYKGTRQIYNRANNPGTIPSTADLAELQYINQQNTTNTRKSELGAMAELQAVLKEDVSRSFIDKFRTIFDPILGATAPLYYINNPEDTQI